MKRKHPINPNRSLALRCYDDNTIIFQQMFCCFEGAMGGLCNQEVTKQDDKKMASLARNSLMTDLEY